MMQLVSLFSESSVMLAMRQYKQNGPYFMIKLKRNTGDIISCYRINEMPSNWPPPFIEEIKETADRFIVNRSKKVN
jgi:hypothetical protein